MLKVLEGTSEKAISLEIVDGYETTDEKSIEKLFEKKLATGVTKVNIFNENWQTKTNQK